jgi:hypothetical protein
VIYINPNSGLWELFGWKLDLPKEEDAPLWRTGSFIGKTISKFSKNHFHE